MIYLFDLNLSDVKLPFLFILKGGTTSLVCIFPILIDHDLSWKILMVIETVFHDFSWYDIMIIHDVAPQGLRKLKF